VARTTPEDRFKTPWFYVLLALAGEQLHASAIERDVHTLSEGRVRLWPVTLCSTLDALTERGLIAELSPAERPPGESAKKRFYRITARGRRTLQREARHIASVAEEARMRLNPRG
jgi:DNA-binding PadR family transcriptional regulator